MQNVDADGLVVAVFRQHTSRMLDPQLHTHAVVVAKVRIPDGRWLALDARLIKHDQRALSALLDELSQRTRQVDARLERKLDRFRGTFDRDPKPRERRRLEREAVLDSRPSKRCAGEHVDLSGDWAEREGNDVWVVVDPGSSSDAVRRPG